MRNGKGAIVLVALVPMVLLALDPAGWYPFGPSKWLVASVLVPAGVAVLWWSRPMRSVRPLTWAAGLLVGWLAVAALVGADGVYAWVGTPERHLGVLTWALCTLALMAGQTLDVEHDRPILTGGLALAGLGLGGLATAEALGFEPDAFRVTAGRLTATMGSAAYLGAATALLLPAVVGIAVDRRLHRRVRLAAAAAIPLVAIACIGSGARAAWVGLATAAVTACVVRRRTLLAHRRVAALGGLGVALALVAVVGLTSVGPRLGAAADPDAAGGRSRVDEWRVAARVIERHPLSGVGPEGYRIAFAEGADDAYEQAHGRDPLPDRAHSAPLDVALAGGLPALAAWCLIVALVLRASVRAIRTDRGWLAGVGAGLIAHLVGQLLLFPTAELEPVAWLLAGLLVAATTPAVDVRERSVARPVVGVLGAVALVALYAGGRDLAADRRAETAVAAARGGDHDRAVLEAQRAVDLRPDEVRLHLLLARMLLDDDRGTAPALRAVDDALRLSPDDPIARRQRASLLVQRAASTHLPVDIRAARDGLAELVATDPANGALQLLAGTAAELDGDAGPAEQAFLRAEALTPRSATASIELALLYLGTDRTADARAAADRAVARDPQDRQAREILDRATGAR